MELYQTSLFSDANLLAYYRFNSGALTTDSKGSYTLTNNNSVGESAIGKYGYCADFGTANTNKAFSRTDAMGLTTNKTLSLWIKMRTEISTGRQTFFFSYNKTDGRTFGIDYEYNSGTRRLSFNGNKVDSAVQVVEYNITLGTEAWYHLAFTYNGSIQRAYVNGSEVGNLSTSSIGNNGYNNVSSIGSYINVINYSLSVFSSAFIDDVALFSRALTADEIALLAKDISGGAMLDYFNK